MSKGKGTLKVLAIGSAVAAGIGYVAGLLTAPKSGKETRQDIKTAAEKTRREAEQDLKRLHSELDKLINQAKDKGGKAGSKANKQLTELVETAKDTREKAREMLSALHEGDAEDEDLKRAIKNANDALEHLRDYLKK